MRWFIVAAIFLLLGWLLVDVILLAIASVLVSVALTGLARQISRRTGLTHGWALALAALIIAAILVAALVLFGTQVSAQLLLLAQQLPTALANLQQRFGVALSMGDMTKGPLSDLGTVLVGQFARAGKLMLNGLATLLLILVSGVYIAVDPGLYKRGAIALIPPRLRPQMDEAFDTVGNAWYHWFGAQLIAMLLIAVLVGVGTSFIGLPAPLALGLIAGLLEFIPIIGPILGAVPALLFALAEGGNAVWWTLGLFLLVQQLESNLISPILQQRIVSLPPALLMFAIVASGTLLGPVGIFLAAPLAILVYVLVVTFYIRGTLGEDAVAPGED